ncbi:4-oxalocrotonate tautomerase [Cohaesibacter marisflavi]|uniref:4-oxalocrotonate tautomerase n=1 Tax=Cohaesibacter marisflavi TaxID=655353 RepID=A0A1I5INM7_9HYPH|nr:tautomerase family protein [Cohaesibacter marisflavi]SFO62218.1 4-oxalocrotonate tautomerase [Cohaesibacter marisflavi]
MPVITMTLGADQIDQQKKTAFIQTVTKSAAEITNIPEQSFIVFIEQLDSDNIGVGGVSLTEKRKLRAS